MKNKSSCGLRDACWDVRTSTSWKMLEDCNSLHEVFVKVVRTLVTHNQVDWHQFFFGATVCNGPARGGRLIFREPARSAGNRPRGSIDYRLCKSEVQAMSWNPLASLCWDAGESETEPFELADIGTTPCQTECTGSLEQDRPTHQTDPQKKNMQRGSAWAARVQGGSTGPRV